jgi:hypothetical protein
MHDLNTINRLNAETVGQTAQRERAAGKHVVVKFTGLHAVGYETYSTLDAAKEAYDAAVDSVASPDVRYVLLAPLSEAEAAVVRGRDQSEDRTLGDYVQRVRRAEGQSSTAVDDQVLAPADGEGSSAD